MRAETARSVSPERNEGPVKVDDMAGPHPVDVNVDKTEHKLGGTDSADLANANERVAKAYARLAEMETDRLSYTRDLEECKKRLQLSETALSCEMSKCRELESRATKAESLLATVQKQLVDAEESAAEWKDVAAQARQVSASLSVGGSEAVNTDLTTRLRDELEEMQSMVENLTLDLELEKEKYDILAANHQLVEAENVRVKEERDMQRTIGGGNDAIERYQGELAKVKATLKELALSSEAERLKLLAKVC